MLYPSLFLDYCDSISSKFTSLRRRILYILWSTNKPLKAYEILEELVNTIQNAQAPTVYRVLDYFVSAGIVHKIESIQSYTLCHEPHKKLPSEILMVCDQCHGVQEVYNKPLHILVKKVSEEQQFSIGQDVIELRGLCKNCMR
jgi:Fur family zinc uptake transcriptional regulator